MSASFDLTLWLMRHRGTSARTHIRTRLNIYVWLIQIKNHIMHICGLVIIFNLLPVDTCYWRKYPPPINFFCCCCFPIKIFWRHLATWLKGFLFKQSVTKPSGCSYIAEVGSNTVLLLWALIYSITQGINLIANIVCLVYSTEQLRGSAAYMQVYGVYVGWWINLYPPKIAI